jgi:hypothetical protein
MEFETQLHQVIIYWREGEIEGAKAIWEIKSICGGTHIHSELTPPQELSLVGDQAYISLAGVLSKAQIDAFKRLDETLALMDIVQRDNRQLHQLVARLIERRAGGKEPGRQK